MNNTTTNKEIAQILENTVNTSKSSAESRWFSEDELSKEKVGD